MHSTHFLYPGSQVWRALIEARVLDKMFLTLLTHHTAVIPVEVVEVGVIIVRCCAGVSRATCIVTPGGTLEIGRTKDTLDCKNIKHLLFDGDICIHHLTVKVSLRPRFCFVVFAIHTHVEFVQR